MLSKKFKAQVKRIATSTVLAVSTVAVLFGMGANLDSIVNTVREGIARINGNEIKAENVVDVIKDSNGISIKVNAEDSTGIRKIEVLQGSTSVEVHNYDGSKTEVEQAISVSVPFGETKTFTVKVNGNTIKQQEITNMRCISTAQDLVNFRNLVNDGNTFEGMYVELVNDIDLSSICSSTVGNWSPIGNNNKSFKGIFNGNFYKLENLYYKGNNWRFICLFYSITGVVENLLLVNPYIYNTYYQQNQETTSNGIVRYVPKGAVLRNCATIGGSVTTISNCTRDGSYWPFPEATGLAGYVEGTIENCYNSANITAYSYTNDYNVQSHAGGIAGQLARRSFNE